MFRGIRNSIWIIITHTVVYIDKCHRQISYSDRWRFLPNDLSTESLSSSIDIFYYALSGETLIKLIGTTL